MIKRIKYLILSIIILIICSFSNSLSETEKQLLLFKPLVANVFEPRIGTFYQFEDEKLRLDIGASYDLKHFQLDTNLIISVGADFFTFTRLRTAGNFKFPVETSDYFFGVNSALKTKLFGDDFFVRLRLAHISSHLVDGMASDGVFSDKPFVYSREFIDVVAAIKRNNFRVYLGATLLFHSIPDEFSAIIPQVGIEYSYPINNWIEFIVGIDNKLTGKRNNTINTYSAQLGLSFNTSENIGLFVGAYYYNGYSMHGMYYDDKDNYLGVGFQINFY